MCLAVPARIISIEENRERGTVDVLGVTREAILATLDSAVEPGDYVLIHAGFAIRKINTVEALKTLELHRSVAGKQGEQIKRDSSDV